MNKKVRVIFPLGLGNLCILVSSLKYAAQCEAFKKKVDIYCKVPKKDLDFLTASLSLPYSTLIHARFSISSWIKLVSLSICYSDTVIFPAKKLFSRWVKGFLVGENPILRRYIEKRFFVRSEYELYLEIFGLLGIVSPQMPVDAFRGKVSSYPSNSGGTLKIGFLPGSSSKLSFKRLNIDLVYTLVNLFSVSDRLEVKVLLGPAEKSEVCVFNERVLDFLALGVPIEIQTFDTIEKLVDLSGDLTFAVAADNGPAHLLQAFEKFVFVIFGPTSSIKNSHYSNYHIPIRLLGCDGERNNRPCGKCMPAHKKCCCCLDVGVINKGSLVKAVKKVLEYAESV